LAFLSLSDDELALLRFTCDLFFVPESPLWSLDAAQREPMDYEAAYQSLVEKEVVDPHVFRVTDAALNRLAPLTECDARVVHVQRPPAGKIEQRDYFLLDDIAVQYASADGMHAIGEDKDPDELVAHLARRLVPRRSSGDRLRLLLTPLELVCLARLLAAPDAEEELSIEGARALLGGAPSATPAVTSAPLLAAMGVRAPQVRAPTVAASLEEETRLLRGSGWDRALAGLTKKGALRRTEGGLRVRPALVELARALGESEQHTFVRYDFGDEEWLLRETTFLPAPGGLFFLGATHGGDIVLEELDGSSLKAGLHAAVGPLPRAQSAPEPRRLRGLFEEGPAREDSGA
jgi:hypothetical protein